MSTGSSALSSETEPSLTSALKMSPSMVRSLPFCLVRLKSKHIQMVIILKVPTYICMPLHPVPQNPINIAHCFFVPSRGFGGPLVCPCGRVPRRPRCFLLSLGGLLALLDPPVGAFWSSVTDEEDGKSCAGGPSSAISPRAGATS